MKRWLAGLAVVLSITAAHAQQGLPGGGGNGVPSGGGGGGSGGSGINQLTGAVTAGPGSGSQAATIPAGQAGVIQTGPGATGGNCNMPTTCTIQTALAPGSTFTTSGTIASTDAGKLVTANCASACTITLNNLTANQFTRIISKGAGAVTIAAGTGSINQGCASLAQNASADPEFDGTNWNIACGAGSGGGSGNTTISPATGNTVNDIATMSNTTTTIKDSGIPISSVAPAPPAAYVTGGTRWYPPLGTIIGTTGSAEIASTQYCYVGGVSRSVTISSLGASTATGAAGSAVAFGIYSVSIIGGVTTFTHIDNTGSIATTANNFGASGTLGSAQTLSPGTLYAWCTQINATGGQVMWSLNSTSYVNVQMAGSTTLTTATQENANLTGWSIAITYGTWPSTLTLNSGSGDMTELGSARAPLMAFLVN